ncbi:hypothetical protein LINPERHAP1_LOCUS26250 [Linum perenne]
MLNETSKPLPQSREITRVLLEFPPLSPILPLKIVAEIQLYFNQREIQRRVKMLQVTEDEEEDGVYQCQQGFCDLMVPMIPAIATPVIP